MSGQITHTGIVTKVSGSSLTVRVLRQEACASCRLSSCCSVPSGREQLVDIPYAGGRYQVGDRLTVGVNGSSGRLALVWAFGLPLLLMVGSIVVVQALSGSEAWAALAGLGVLVPYFLLLRSLRRWFRRKIQFFVV